MALTFGPGIRLRSRAEFLAVQEQGRRVPMRYFTLLGLPTSGTADRLGIVASRRLGGAVIRNRAKRRLREIFRQQRAPGDGGRRRFDLVVIARRELIDAPFAAVQAEFLRGLTRLRQVKPS